MKTLSSHTSHHRFLINIVKRTVWYEIIINYSCGIYSNADGIDHCCWRCVCVSVTKTVCFFWPRQLFRRTCKCENNDLVWLFTYLYGWSIFRVVHSTQHSTDNGWTADNDENELKCLCYYLSFGCVWVCGACMGTNGGASIRRKSTRTKCAVLFCLALNVWTHISVYAYEHVHNRQGIVSFL